MEWKRFHHPDYNFTIIRRRAADQLLSLMLEMGIDVISRGRSLVFNSSRPDDRAHTSALYRLRKSGLIVRSHSDGSSPDLRLTPEAEARRPAFCAPEKFWNEKWSGFWYILMYDVPEKNRAYRDTLRGFLDRMRMGCLQLSVWITPFDIRPEFDDLNKGASIHEYAYLFESKSVLGRDPCELVERAWPMDELRKLHQWYLEVYGENLARLAAGTGSAKSLLELANEELSAYFTAMDSDPLLPSTLLPDDYLGQEVYQLHRKLMKEIARQI